MAYDGIVQTRVDRRDLATCVRFFHENGIVVTNSGALVREIVEHFSMLLVEKGLAQKVVLTEDANYILGQFFDPRKLNPSGRGLRALSNALGEDERVMVKRVDLSPPGDLALPIDVEEVRRRAMEIQSHDSKELRTMREVALSQLDYFEEE